MDKSKTTDSSNISSSTESETFETWTLVTPEIAEKTDSDLNSAAAPNVEKSDKRKVGPKKDESHTDGELSDGISVISDSESAGRSSPQSAPRRGSPIKRISATKDLLTENESDNPDEGTTTSTFELITPPSTPEDADLSQTESDKYEPLTQSLEETPTRASSHERHILPGLNFTLIFYLSLFMAFLAILGRIKSPEWDNRNPVVEETERLTRAVQRLSDSNALILKELKHLTNLVENRGGELNDKRAEIRSTFARWEDLSPERVVKFNRREEEKLNKREDEKFNKPDGEKFNKHEEKFNKYEEKFNKHEEKYNKHDGEKFNKHEEKYNKHEGDKLNKREDEKSKERIDVESLPPPNTNPLDDFEQPSINNKSKKQFVKRQKDKYNEEKYAEEHKHKEPYAKIPDVSEEYRSRQFTTEDQTDWHNNMMHQRAEFRKQNGGPQRKRSVTDESNWYLERGSGRRDARKPEKTDKIRT